MTSRRWVLGFAFSPDLERVILIQKRKPAFQHGKLNGIGGSIEQNEKAIDAMAREFTEETGCPYHNKWTPFVRMVGPDWECYCYFTVLEQVYFDACHDAEIDYVIKAEVKKLPPSCMRNLHWLIPMALNWDNEISYVRYDSVQLVEDILTEKIK